MDTQKQELLNSRTFFFSVIIFSALSILMMFLEGAMDFLGQGIFVFWILLTLSGIGLVVFTFKEKKQGRKKLFLLMAGFSAAGFFVFVFLHNAFYALSTLTDHIVILDAVLNFLEGLFFLAATIVCPLGMIAGIIGTFITQKDRK